MTCPAQNGFKIMFAHKFRLATCRKYSKNPHASSSAAYNQKRIAGLRTTISNCRPFPMAALRLLHDVFRPSALFFWWPG
jgi:hypothetical protein